MCAHDTTYLRIVKHRNCIWHIYIYIIALGKLVSHCSICASSWFIFICIMCCSNSRLIISCFSIMNSILECNRHIQDIACITPMYPIINRVPTKKVLPCCCCYLWTAHSGACVDAFINPLIHEVSSQACNTQRVWITPTAHLVLSGLVS